VLFWRVLGAYSVCGFLLEQERPLPPRRDLWNLLAGGGERREWDCIHWNAQVQAALYSWRMVKQCIAIFMILPSEQRSGDESLMDAVEQMNEWLQEMPSISELFDTPLGLGYNTAVESAILCLHKILDVQEQESATAEPTKSSSEKKRKRKRKRKKVTETPKTSSAVNSRTPSNMYDLLSFDNS